MRPVTDTRSVITVHPAGAVALTVAYEQSHRLLNAARVRAADEGTDQALRAMGCEPELIWTAIQPD